MALGAHVGDVLRLVVVRGMKLVSIGLALGPGVAWLMTRFLSRFLYQVSATNPVTFAAIASQLVPVAPLGAA